MYRAKRVSFQVFADHQHQKYLSQQGDVDMLQRQLAAADAEKTAVEKRLYAKVCQQCSLLLSGCTM
eukprot:SAG31_NODE_2012_length_6668_cov_5.925407_7_plen_66_part_00